MSGALCWLGLHSWSYRAARPGGPVRVRECRHCPRTHYFCTADMSWGRHRCWCVDRVDEPDPVLATPHQTAYDPRESTDTGGESGRTDEGVGSDVPGLGRRGGDRRLPRARISERALQGAVRGARRALVVRGDGRASGDDASGVHAEVDLESLEALVQAWRQYADRVLCDTERDAFRHCADELAEAFPDPDESAAAAETGDPEISVGIVRISRGQCPSTPWVLQWSPKPWELLGDSESLAFRLTPAPGVHDV